MGTIKPTIIQRYDGSALYIDSLNHTTELVDPLEIARLKKACDITHIHPGGVSMSAEESKGGE